MQVLGQCYLVGLSVHLAGVSEATEATPSKSNPQGFAKGHRRQGSPRTPWLFRSRFRLCWEDSATLLIQTLVYIAVLELVAAFGLQHVFRLFRNDIERLLATLTGDIIEKNSFAARSTFMPSATFE